ncbi:MAG: Ig-like domain-containing protein [Dehalococcoidia bacterium]|nr:Ig-like domain-containing protein [Dehalococcoidia bacterium]
MKREKFWGILAVALVLSMALSMTPLGSGPEGLPAIQAAGPGVRGEPGPSAQVIPASPQRPVLPGDPGPEQVREIPRGYPVDAATFGQMKAEANAAASGRKPPPPPGDQTAPPPDFAAIAYTGWNPPDGALAAGPSSLLAAVNESFAFYNKANQALWGPGVVAFQDFFGLNESIFDPRALYDKARGRFVLLAVSANTQSRTSYFTLAVSKNDNPANAAESWCKYSFNATTGSGRNFSWADFPGLGMDGEYLYVTSHQFSFGGSQFTQARLLVIPKSSVYPDGSSGCGAGNNTSNFSDLTNLDGSAAFSVMPASRPDALAGQVGIYLVNAIWASGSRLALRSVSYSGELLLSPPAWVYVSSYDLPADAPQPDTARLIDTGDTRLSQAVERYGAIYTANTTRTVSASLSASPSPYANVQWYKITAGTASSYAVTNPDVAYFFPGVMPGCGGACPGSGVFVGFEVSGSGPSQAASAFWGRDGSAPAAFAPGVGGYTLNSRFGDYPGVSADPADTGKVWVLGEYAATDGAWGTAVTDIGGGSPNTAPTADGATVTTNEDTAAIATLTARDPEQCDLTFTIVSGPASGALSPITTNACGVGSPNSASATVTYTPDPNFNGADGFSFRVNDGLADSSVASVSITVNAVNDAPVAQDKTASTTQGTPAAVTLAATDVDNCDLTFTIVRGPASGALSDITINPCAGGSPNSDSAAVTYTPNLNVNGADDFTYKVNDGLADSNVASVSITVHAVTVGTVHVGDLDGESVRLPQGNWKARSTITVHDTGHNPQAGYTVSGTFTQNGTTVGSRSCTTDSTGACTLEWFQLPNKGGNATFTVTDVSGGSLSYDRGSNHDPDGDSDGTSITISK